MVERNHATELEEEEMVLLDGEEMELRTKRELDREPLPYDPEWIRDVCGGPAAITLGTLHHPIGDGIAFYIGKTKGADGLYMQRSDVEWLRDKLTEWLDDTTKESKLERAVENDD